MSTYPYYNEAGEPLMDGQAMRYEMYLDSLYEPDPDDFYNDYEDEEIDPADCDHKANWSSYERNGRVEVQCDDCYTDGVATSWDEDGWIDDIQWEVA